jgi:hypothetical protein
MVISTEVKHREVDLEFKNATSRIDNPKFLQAGGAVDRNALPLKIVVVYSLIQAWISGQNQSLVITFKINH